MALPVELLAEATAEAAEARAWYEARDPAVAADFIRELDAAIAAIADAPDRWPAHRRGTRRYLLRRFPFSIVYTSDADRVRVIAVAHSRREPGYWDRRA